MVNNNILIDNDNSWKFVGIQMHNELLRALLNLRHIPKLKKNLISIIASDVKVFTCNVKNEWWECRGNPCKFMGIGSIRIQMHDGLVRKHSWDSIIEEEHHPMSVLVAKFSTCNVKGGVMRVLGKRNVIVM